jgi:predicted glycogen debranching enzyme
MDARIGDWVVTPRRGKPVEIQALWYNALRVMQDLAPRFGEDEQAAHYRALADAAEVSFRRQFWNPARGCLYDVVDGAEPDASLRPNQVLAVSLPHSMLPRDRARSVVDVVEQELLTPFGLRTLERCDPRYCAIYEGDVWKRDSSYHQGIVWPWLMGPFLSAYLRVHGKNETSRQQARQWLEPFRDHLTLGGLNQVSEILDAEPPYRPRGCYAQAWSVAELLRAAVEILT